MDQIIFVEALWAVEPVQMSTLQTLVWSPLQVYKGALPNGLTTIRMKEHTGKKPHKNFTANDDDDKCN